MASNKRLFGQLQKIAHVGLEGGRFRDCARHHCARSLRSLDKLRLDHVDSTATLEWSVDDGLEWNLYEGPVEVEQTTNVLAQADKSNDYVRGGVSTMLSTWHSN